MILKVVTVKLLVEQFHPHTTAVVKCCSVHYAVQVGELFLERSDHQCRDKQGFMDHIQVT